MGCPLTATRPEITADVDRYADLLTPAERRVLGRLREVLDTRVQPLLADYWERGEFPYQILPPLIELNLMRPAEITCTGAEPLSASSDS